MIYLPNKTLYGDFKMYEVARSYTAQRNGIDNTPTDAVLERAEQVAIHIAQPIRDEFGRYSPSSWYRCEKLEKLLTRNSFKKWCRKYNYTSNEYDVAWDDYFSRKSHPLGEAIDLEIPGVDNHYLFSWCVKNLKMYDQLIKEFMVQDDSTAGWLHASLKCNRHEIITLT